MWLYLMLARLCLLREYTRPLQCVYVCEHVCVRVCVVVLDVGASLSLAGVYKASAMRVDVSEHVCMHT